MPVHRIQDQVVEAPHTSVRGEEVGDTEKIPIAKSTQVGFKPRRPVRLA